MRPSCVETLPGLEDHDRDRSGGGGAVRDALRVGRHETRPEPCHLVWSRRSRADATTLRRDLDLRQRLVTKVQPPRRIVLRSGIRRDDDEVRGPSRM
jgi:hypothetical protein